MALLSIIYGPIHLFNTSCGFQKIKKFNEKIYLREKFDSSNYLCLLWTGLSLRRESRYLSMNNHFLSLLILLISARKINLKGIYGHIAQVTSLSKIQKKIYSFSFKI